MRNYSKNTPVNIAPIGGYTIEQILNNKNCSKDPKYWYNIKNSNKYVFKSKCAESWELWDASIINPIRNTNQIYLKFKDVSKFVKPSNYFREYGVFTHELEDTIAGEQYWDDIEEKVLNGFEWEGVRITGRHFFTINFGRFRAIPVDEFGKATSKNKIWTFLRFLDHQYYAFNELDECLLNGVFNVEEKYLKWFPNKTAEDFEMLTMENFILTKSRRKGWSAIEGVGLIDYNFTHQESSMNIIAAYDKKHYKPLLAAVSATKAFCNQHTPWVRVTDLKGTREHFIAGIKTVDEFGVSIEEGYLSEVSAISFQDNPFKGIGDSADLLIVEEPGKFDTLLETYPVSIEPLIRDGENRIGVCILGGSAGDMEGGGSTGLAKIMYNPLAYGFKCYNNIYEEKNNNDTSGWFIDDLWYLPFKISKEEILKIDDSDYTKSLLDKYTTNYVVTVDEMGNSYRYFADLILSKKRKLQKVTDIKSYNKFITQQPKYLSEAFLLNESSPFDTATAQEVLGELMSKRDKLPIEKGNFVLGETGIRWNLNLSLQSIDVYPFDTSAANTDGCWVIYEKPIKDSVNTNTWRYLAGTDPIDFGRDESADSKRHSLAATYIIDTLTRNIVAEYVGRPPTAENYYEQLWRGIEYYNATLLYENNLKGLFAYFQTKNKLHLLAKEPDSLKDKLNYKPNNRSKGFHATAPVNSYGRNLINKWTLELVVQGQDNDGENIYIPRMWYIKSPALLQEIIEWKSTANFDRVSGLGAAMLLLFDKLYEYDIEDKTVVNMMESGIFAKVRKQLKNSNTFNINNYATNN